MMIESGGGLGHFRGRRGGGRRKDRHNSGAEYVPVGCKGHARGVCTTERTAALGHSLKCVCVFGGYSLGERG